MLIYGLGEILHKQLDIKFFCVKRISYKTIKVLNRCLHYMGRNNLFHKELSLGILTISIYHSKVFIMMNIQTYMHLFVLRFFMRHFYALHISICQNQKNIYFHKYRKYCVKYNHLKHQVEDIWINQSDDSDSSIDSMDILEFFGEEFFEDDDYIDNM